MSEKEMKYLMTNGDEMTLTFDTVKNYLVTGNRELVTQQELLYFMHECKARKLNPFLRQCWLIKYSENEPAQIVESIHHKRNRAMQHETCQGWEKGIIIKGEDGKIKETNGIILDGEKLVGAFFRATPKGWNVPYELQINLEGYIKKKRNGDTTAFWQKEKQPSQLMKVVESQGLSALWGNDSSATYIEEELPSHEPINLMQSQNGTYEPTTEQPEPVDTSQFDILVDEQPNYMKSKLDEFIKATADANDSTVDNLKLVAIEKFDEFWGSYEKWFYPKALAHAKENDPASYETASQIHECVGYEIAKMKPIQQKAIYETFRKMKK